MCPARSCRSSQPADSIDQHTRVLFFDSACAMGDCWHVKHGTVVWNSRPFIKTMAAGLPESLDVCWGISHSPVGYVARSRHSNV